MSLKDSGERVRACLWCRQPIDAEDDFVAADGGMWHAECRFQALEEAERAWLWAKD